MLPGDACVAGWTVVKCKASLNRWLSKASLSFLCVYSTHMGTLMLPQLSCISPFLCVSNNNLGHGKSKHEEMGDDEQLSPTN